MTETNDIAAVIVAELLRQDIDGDWLYNPYVAEASDGRWIVDGEVDIKAIAAAILAAGYRRDNE